MKQCPNCGRKLSEGARFCANCGYHFAPDSASRSAAQETTRSARHSAEQASTPPGRTSVPPLAKVTISRQAKRPKHHHHWGWLLVLIFLLAVAGSWFYSNHDSGDSSTAAPTSSSSASQTSEKDSASDTQSSSAGNDAASATSSSSTAGKLTTDIGPKNTASAVTYYAAKNGVSHWRGVLNTTDGITVKLSTDDDLLNALSEPGQGMAYLVYGYHDVDSGDETDFVYTVDRDDTIHIYTLPNDFDSDQTYEPEMTVSKQDMVTYLNDHSDAGDVAKLSNKVDIDH